MTESADAKSDAVDATAESDDKMKVLKFDLELTAFESQITDKPALDFEDARNVFLAVQKWINSSKEFYVLSGHCTDHIEIVQDHSNLFKLLSFFEPNFDRQCKMHKRRADMYQDLLNEVSMQHYLLVCRQLIYELAEIYSTMVDIKLAIIEESQTPPTPHATSKMNQLVAQSLKQFTAYIDSLRGTDKQLPSKFNEDDERPALVAYFCMGRLHSKFLEFEVSKRLQNITNSIEKYKFVDDYCKKNPEAEPKMRSEREICAEMVALLPAKMAKIHSESLN